MNNSTVTLASDQSIDALNFGGDQLVHSGGRLTVGSGGVEGVSSFGENFGTTSAYAMSGTAHFDQADGGSFWLGNFEAAGLTMRDDSRITSNGSVALGLGADFNGSVSDRGSIEIAGQFRIGDIFPHASISFSDSSTLSAGSIFMNELGHSGGTAMLSFIGSSVSASADRLHMAEGSTLEFSADASGVSPLFISGPINFNNFGGPDPVLSVDLSSYAGTGAIR